MKKNYLNVCNPTGKHFYVTVLFNHREVEGELVNDAETIEGDTMPTLFEIYASIVTRLPSDCDLAGICRDYPKPTKSYDEIVSRFVHCRYSADAEMAMAANMRCDPDKYKSEEQIFQEWRTRAKAAAAELLTNEGVGV